MKKVAFLLFSFAIAFCAGVSLTSDDIKKDATSVVTVDAGYDVTVAEVAVIDYMVTINKGRGVIPFKFLGSEKELEGYLTVAARPPTDGKHIYLTYNEKPAKSVGFLFGIIFYIFTGSGVIPYPRE